MGHGKETPRQKMIGMMYLVLTALLALNVSSDILNAFVLVDEGLVKTTTSFVAKNETSYSIFDAEMEKTPDKVRPFRDKAYRVKDMADQLAFDLQELKVEIVRYCDGANAPSLSPVDWTIGEKRERKSTFNVNGDEVKAKDNMDKPAEIMITKNGGAELKKKIEAFREELLSMTTDPSVQQAIQQSLNTGDMTNMSGTTISWEVGHFENIPLIAVVTLLSKMQSDVRNAEADIVKNLLDQIGATDTKVNKMEAIVQARTSYILRGGEYEARILLAAYDSLQKPEIMIGPYTRTESGYEMVGEGRSLPYDERGRAMFRTTPSSAGTYNLTGLLRMAGPDGMVSYPFNSEYQVGESSTVISATNMNVLYVGLDNPISILMAGVPAERISASMTNGTITRSGSGWVAKPASPNSNSVITASANIEGRTITGSPQTYRVRMVPAPIARVGGRSSGQIDKNVLMGQQGVNAEMDNFLFDLRFVVTQFNVMVNTAQGERNEPSTSAAFTQAQKNLINGTQRGQMVIFTNIKARGPAGNIVDLSDINFRIN